MPDADDLLRNLTSNLPFRNELMRLFDHTLKLKGSGRGDRKKKRPKKPTSKRREPSPFHPQRFPSFFRAELSDRANGTPMVQIPLGGQRTIKFSTDVENQYFDRIMTRESCRSAYFNSMCRDEGAGVVPYPAV